uniref:Molybdopterin biosynthesis protein CNX1 n=1 Tax=Aceria tosichella TaxID=561515 RepID=A0A6G1S8M0_9ACAR
MSESGERTKKYNAVVVVTSDTCCRDPTQDESGPYVVEALNDFGLFKNVHKFIVSDDMDNIIKCLKKAFTTYDPALIITIGGTGMCPRDVTPEATSSLYDKHCSGITAALHSTCYRYTPHAALSRLTSGIVGATLIVNFPGKLKACRDCFSCLELILDHALEQVRSDFESYSATHQRQQAGDKVQRQLRSPSGKCIELSVSSSSLSSMNNGHAKPTKNRLGLNQQQPRSRSSSEVSKHKLSIKAIQESRDEISSLEQDNSDENLKTSEIGIRQPKAANWKHFHPKPGNPNVNTKPKAHPQPNKQPKAPQLQPQKQIVPLPQIKILQNKSSYPSIRFDESLKILADKSSYLFDKPEEVDLTTFPKAFSCVGATLAEDLAPKRIVPPFAVSTMDGYVLNVHAVMKDAIKDVKNFPPIEVVPNLQEFERRQKDQHLQQKFFCYQINTGGRLPKFHYAVIPVEKTNQVSEDRITIDEVKQGLYVRRAGCDIGENDVIKKGTVIGSVELTSIIAMGHRKFKILPCPKLGVLSTGDEVQSFFTNEFTNQDSVVDMNGPLLSSMLRLQGYHVVQGGVARDDPSELFHKIKETLTKCDVLLITGGASMGSRDHVKDVIQYMGGDIHFGRVEMKPGKPVSFATVLIGDKRKFIFSLPGNPVSAFITAFLLVIPFLKHGAERYSPKPKQIYDHVGENIWVQVGSIVDGERSVGDGEETYRFEGRLEFLRAKILSKKMEFHDGLARSMYLVEVSVKQQSSRLLSLVDCDCLMVADPALKGKSLRPGHILPAFKLNRKF